MKGTLNIGNGAGNRNTAITYRFACAGTIVPTAMEVRHVLHVIEK